MSVVVGVHGIGQKAAGEKELYRQWLPALNHGLRRSGAPALKSSDFACAYYVDLLRRNFGRAAGAVPGVDPEQIDEADSEILEVWSQEAAHLEIPMAAHKRRIRVGTPYGVQRCLKMLSRSKLFVGMAERALIASLKEVTAYFKDDEFRRQLRARVEAVVTPDTRVIVAHSLGSVVAYECLCAHPEWSVHTFITLGSPLGIRNLVFDRLRPAPIRGVGVWPGSITHWVNIADRGDVIALVKNLRSRFGANVEDRIVNNGATVHAVTAYLAATEAGRAVSAALGHRGPPRYLGAPSRSPSGEEIRSR